MTEPTRTQSALSSSERAAGRQETVEQARLVGSYRPQHDEDCELVTKGCDICGCIEDHPLHNSSHQGFHRFEGNDFCTCGLDAALLREQAQQAEIQPPIDILNELHLRMANHGIASRAFVEYEGLVTELISWAARGCRQSQNEKAEAWREKWINDKGIRDARIAELETALLAAARDRDALKDAIKMEVARAHELRMRAAKGEEVPYTGTFWAGAERCAEGILELFKSPGRDALTEERDRQEQEPLTRLEPSSAKHQRP